MVNREIICDICESKKFKVFEKVQIQVIFVTEQTEGRGVDPYLSDETIDICESCLQKRLDGESIYGQGAQGYNNYYFNERDKK